MATIRRTNSRNYNPPPPSTVLNTRSGGSRSKTISESSISSRRDCSSSATTALQSHFALKKNNLDVNFGDEQWVCFTDGNDTQGMAFASAPPFEATLDFRDDFFSQEITSSNTAADFREGSRQEVSQEDRLSQLPNVRPHQPRSGNARTSREAGSIVHSSSTDSESAASRRRHRKSESSSASDSRSNSNNESLKGRSREGQTETVSSQSSRERSISRGAPTQTFSRSASQGAPVKRRQRSASQGAPAERRHRSASRGAPTERRQRSASRGAPTERRQRSASRGVSEMRTGQASTRVNQGLTKNKSRTQGECPGEILQSSSSTATPRRKNGRSIPPSPHHRGRSIPPSPQHRGKSVPAQQRNRSKSRGAQVRSGMYSSSQSSGSLKRSSSVGSDLFMANISSPLNTRKSPDRNRNNNRVLSSSAATILSEVSTKSSNGRSNNNAKVTGGIREKLFGDQVPKNAKLAYLPNEKSTSPSKSNASTAPSSSSLVSSHVTVSLPKAIHTRVLLKSSVYHNSATDLWISTVNTNQKAFEGSSKKNSKYLKAFSFLTEREAKESSYANAPPRMLPFSANKNCFICQGKFALFRRASHCRNCGVCVCNSCSVSWHKAMVPDTYNSKSENYVKVCKSCDFLSKSFRQALLHGHYDNAVALYNSGNINLRCPFMNVKRTETMFPIHCAAQGGNLVLVRWLVDVHYCPIKMIRTGNKKNKGTTNELLSTSRGRNIMDIAMEGKYVDILRYLVREKGVSVHEIKDIKTSLDALQVLLSSANEDGLLYDDYCTEDYDTSEDEDERERERERERIEDRRNKFQRQNNRDHAPSFDINLYDDDDDDECDVNEDAPNVDSTGESDDESVATTIPDACIICYENTIDCVITPCGHQICCLQCSQNLKTCPVCNANCQFIRIYRP